MTRRGRVALVFGVVAQIVLVVTTLVGGRLLDGYSHLRHPISILGALGADSFWVQNAGLVVVGVALIAYGVALRQVPGAGRASLLLVVAGVGVMGSGLVPCEAGCVFPRGRVTSVRDAVHLSLASSGVVAAMMAPLAAAKGLADRGDLGGYRRLSRWLGWLGLLSVVGYVAVGERTAFAGLSQRLMIVPVAGWLTVTAVLAARLAAAVPPGARTGDGGDVRGAVGWEHAGRGVAPGR